jgi:hypothetical protein
MSAPKKLAAFPPAPIEPDLREFIDSCLVPVLVRAALADLESENRLASPALAVAKSPRSANE